MTVHLYLNCPDIQPDDELTWEHKVHQQMKAPPEEVDCNWCIGQTIKGMAARTREAWTRRTT